MKEKAERFFRLILDSLIFMLRLYEKKNVTVDDTASWSNFEKASSLMYYFRNKRRRRVSIAHNKMHVSLECKVFENRLKSLIWKCKKLRKK